MDLGLSGLRCILPGGTKGIGRATAMLFAAEGATVAVCGRDKAAVAGADYAAFAAGIDLRDADAYRGWLGEAAAALGGCDIFIPFASAGAVANDDAGWQAALDIDLLAFDRGIEALLSHLRASEYASVVAVSSTAALEDPAQAMAYAGMKAALLACASARSQALAADGIRVNSVSPGPVQFAGGVWDAIETAYPDLYASTLARIPAGRMGQADELARLIAFTASPACRYMTGANIVADGGLTRRVAY